MLMVKGRKDASRMSNLRIISDGTIEGTKVIDVETGVLVGRIAQLDIHMEVGQPFATAKIEIVKIPVDITVNAEINET